MMRLSLSSLTRTASLFMRGKWPNVHHCPPSVVPTKTSEEGTQSKVKCARMANAYLLRPCYSCGQRIPGRVSITFDNKTFTENEDTYKGCKEDEESIKRFVEANAPKRDWKTMDVNGFKRATLNLMSTGREVFDLLSGEERSAFCLRRGQLLRKAFEELGQLCKDEDLIAKYRLLRRGNFEHFSRANIDGQKNMARKKKKRNHKRSPQNAQRTGPHKSPLSH